MILSSQCTISGNLVEAGTHIQTAIAQLLKAAENAEKADSYYILASAYSALEQTYANIGDIRNAEEYDAKIIKLRNNTSSVMDSSVFKLYPSAKAALCVAKGQWKEANEQHQKAIEQQMNAEHISIFESSARMSYARTLMKQGQMMEAKIQSDQGLKMLMEIKTRFEHARLMSSLIAPAKAVVGKEFKVRFDVVNVGSKVATIDRTEGLIPSEFRNTTPVTEHRVNESGQIFLKENQLNPFQAELIELSLLAMKEGEFTFKPKIFYTDDHGQKKTSETKLVTITVRPTPKSKSETAAEAPRENQNSTKLDTPNGSQIRTLNENIARFEFKTDAARKVFNFLICSFVEDYMRRRITLEKSGWRTLMEIVKGTKMPRSAVYAVESRHGPAVAELEHRGLVDTRFFPGERGRGGNILKLRVDYEKEIIKRQIDSQILKGQE
jgi:hypothetical protein